MLAVDVEALNWPECAPYIWGWNGGFGTKTPFTGTWGADEYKMTNLEGSTIYYYSISKDFATDNAPYVQFIASDKSDTNRIGASTTLEAGNGYLLKADNGTWTTFTSFDELKSE